MACLADQPQLQVTRFLVRFVKSQQQVNSLPCCKVSLIVACDTVSQLFSPSGVTEPGLSDLAKGLFVQMKWSLSLRTLPPTLTRPHIPESTGGGLSHCFSCEQVASMKGKGLPNQVEACLPRPFTVHLATWLRGAEPNCFAELPAGF